jgi:hypothetical protein
MAPLLGEHRPVTDDHLDNALHVRSCNGRVGWCTLLVVAFGRLCRMCGCCSLV